jgi:hypothetical protein
MPNVSPTLVRAYLRRYTRAQIEQALDAALADHASGVRITSTSFGSGTTAGTISGSTEAIIEILEAALAALDAGLTDIDAAPIASHINFSRRAITT